MLVMDVRCNHFSPQGFRGFGAVSVRNWRQDQLTGKARLDGEGESPVSTSVAMGSGRLPSSEPATLRWRAATGRPRPYAATRPIKRNGA